MLAVCSKCGKRTRQPIFAASFDGKEFLVDGELLCRGCFDRRMALVMEGSSVLEPEPVPGDNRAQVKFNRRVTA